MRTYLDCVPCFFTQALKAARIAGADENMQKKKQGHLFYRYATFYKCDEVIKLLVQAGFVTERIISTLFQEPGKVHRTEEPRQGYSPNAGFTIIVGTKRSSEMR